ncbi:MAG TPA: sugar transferase [Candidatus Sericytochromatia bacterium]
MSTRLKFTAYPWVDLAAPSSLTQADTPQQQVHYSANCKLKRLIDILGALLGLTITAIIAIPIAIAIQLDNPGSIFYSQVRCGLKGKTFRMAR